MKNKRRYIATFSLYLAGLIIFGHSILPHQHHIIQPYFTTIEYNHNNSQINNHHTPVCHHSLPGHEKDHCILQQTFIVVSDKQLKNNISSDNNSHIFTETGFACQIHGLFENINPKGWIYLNADNLPFYFCILNSSQGLRAPPII